MKYTGYLLRRERLSRNWSQEGLCRGICTVSYLSKIEQGKTAPSLEILRLLMERMGLPWHDPRDEDICFINDAYEALLSWDPAFGDKLSGLEPERFLYSPLGADWLILERFAGKDSHPVDQDLEPCLDDRQLALQRVLQGRFEEAVRLDGSGFFYCTAGSRYYHHGQLSLALEAMHSGYRIAAEEGRPRIMLHCKLILGNCYSNQGDLEAMEKHYRTARRLADALGDTDALASMDYNTAATLLETGHYSKALSYFQKLTHPNRMDLHKLAICCEKLGMRQEAMDALERGERAEPSPWMPQGLEERLLELVRIRLTEPQYLKSSRYGKLLLECFRRCQEELPSGYAGFHLPWVLEWYESNRQYKDALELMRNFPARCQKQGLKS